MDFDDLDDAEEAFGPTPADIRDDLMSKQNPLTMPGARMHPKPDGRGFGGGHMKKQKMLYLHGNGSNAKLGRSQVNAVFKNLAAFSDLEFDFWEGSINFKVEEIHADPAVAQLFIPYGNKCGETYDGYLSYVYMYSESHNDETWLGPSHSEEIRTGSISGEGCGYDEVLDAMADQLDRNGPYDGLVAFDIGACLALEAARLAQEEDPRFMNRFRYLVLFSARGHRELAKYQQGRIRPKAPLQVPALLAWSEEDDSKQYSNYEELALYFHPDYRCILKHDQGHRPPNLQKGAKTLEVLESFLSSMQVDSLLHIQDAGEQTSNYKDYWLPLERVVGPSWTGAQRKLVIVGDPLGVHGPLAEESFKDRLRFPAQEHTEICARRLELYRLVTGTTAADFQKTLAETYSGSEVEVVNVTYTNEHQKWDWHPKVEARDVSLAYAAGQGRSRWLQAEDEISISWVQMKYLAEELLETLSITREDDIAIVGLGTGAHVAVALALAVMRIKHIVPIRLFSVAPPTVWPGEDAPGMGALANTPVRYLTYADSVAGPPWRLETSTFGPFSHSHFQDKETLLKLIADEICNGDS